MIAGRWFITPHAIRRYQCRYRGNIRYNQALSELIKLSEVAHFVKTINSGVELWRTGKPHRMRMIVSTRLPGQGQLVTVLKGSDDGS